MSAAIAKREFERGYLIAVANIVNLHGEDMIARNVLEQLGVGRSVLRGMGFTDYDLKPLRALFKEMERLDALPRRATAPQPQSTGGSHGTR